MKIRRKDFKTYTRQCTIKPATRRHDRCSKRDTAREWLREQPRAAVRLLGVGARDLTSTPQLELFTAPETSRNERLDTALDDIRAKFGNDAVARGNSLRNRHPR